MSPAQLLEQPGVAGCADLAIDLARENEALKTEVRAAFERGYRGGLQFAVNVSQERDADLEHVRRRCTAAMEPK